MNNDQVEWIDIDESRYNEPQSKDRQNVVIEMSVSPYDVPHYVRGNLDEQRKKFVIEFKYIDDELVREVRLQPHVTASVGKRSGRIYALLLDVSELGASSIALNIKPDEVRQDATDALSSMHSRLLRSHHVAKSNSKNYQVAKSVLGDYWNSLTESLHLADSR